MEQEKFTFSVDLGVLRKVLIALLAVLLLGIIGWVAFGYGRKSGVEMEREAVKLKLKESQLGLLLEGCRLQIVEACNGRLDGDGRCASVDGLQAVNYHNAVCIAYNDFYVQLESRGK